MAIVLFAILGHLCSGHSEWQRQIAELQRYMGHYPGSQHLLAHAPCCRPPSLPSGLQQIDTLELLDAWGSVGLPLSCPGPYVLGALNTAGCPAQTYYIGTEADCRAAGTALNLMWGEAVDLAAVPRWCSATTTSVYFNSHHLGAGFASARPVCITIGTATPTNDGDSAAPMSSTAAPTGFGDTYAPEFAPTSAPNIADMSGKRETLSKARRYGDQVSRRA